MIDYDTFDKFNSPGMSYDPEEDGIWIQDEKGDPVIFVGRNTIIKAIGLLPADPPKKS